MYRIRFHGRGGQGIKTASRVLGTAFFLAGYQVQDAPRYGAERRGAPIFAYVRADKAKINERGIIQQPDLVVVADDSLVVLPASGVMSGLNTDTAMLLLSDFSTDHWRDSVPEEVPLLVLHAGEHEEDSLARHYTGMIAAGGAAAMLDCITLDQLCAAITQELGSASEAVIKENIRQASRAFHFIQGQNIRVKEGKAISAEGYKSPDWIEVPFEEASISAPVIHATGTSERSQTGLWRTMRPVIDYDKCNKCWWVCSTLCPDGAIRVENNSPQIDLDHCKGCMVCVTVCPPKIIAIKPERIDTETVS